MKNLNVKKMVIPGVYLAAVIAVIACVILTIVSINKYIILSQALYLED